ncbi:YybH family protein [Denitratisoma oestradiolicum]|uniref:Uncharacterized protein n=1 Tax=Denitratisoma oestradiolicum TaxID=311182 RepID=A0A6S6XYR8_9PROT|nr:nuclear transport factor 2 family protein [Denitratisoma oestradiolicum]TWO80092.1 hypothetical protein CBW56_11000 [Denitratisoma oestradiolicum]CAB1370073.1 conserved protein of unknown function [Denitratisoma oestradiolicum]
MPTRKSFFATPDDAEAAFYEALERADLDAMMAIWAEDEEIVCVLPGGPRLAGYTLVREAWRRIFESGFRLNLRVTALSQVVNPFTAIHSRVEHVAVEGDDSTFAPIVATNIFVRGALGWRLVVRHTSPAPPEFEGEIPKILH